jgi:hypothetical protein
VNFGSAPATSFNVVNDTTISAVAPPGHGSVFVTVTTPSGTSATGPASQFSYLPAPFVAQAGTPATTSRTASVSAQANPEGLSTTVHFVYGLDARYSPNPALDITQYNLATLPQSIGSGSSPQTVSATLTGLLPNALYHVRLVATNAAGTTVGPDQTLNTQPAPAPPAPKLGQTENLKTNGGVVFVLEHGQLVPLTQATQLPSGTEIDAVRGSVNLVAATGTKGKSYTGTFGGAIFKLTQARSGRDKGLTTLSLVEGAFPGAPSYASCTARAARAAGAHAALSSRILQTLRSRASGRFRTRGRYAAGTVLGTQWTTTDRCDGTLIAVQVHAVQVTDLVKHITLLVHAGHHYLALAHPPKAKKKHR